MLSRILLLLALLAFAAVALPNLSLPGLHNDEAQEAGLQAQQILAGPGAGPVTAFRGATVAFAGREWPLMVQDYIGALNVFLVVPFFAVLGASVIALRLMALSIGVLTILLMYAFAAEAFGAKPAATAALLLAVHPSFVFWSRQGVFVTSISAALALAAFWAGHRAWARRGRPWWWSALAGLCFGLGVYAKLLFLWVIGGAIGAGLMLALVAVLGRLTADTPHRSACVRLAGRVVPVPPAEASTPLPGLRLARTALLSFLAAFILGLAPLILYNLKTAGTWASVSGNLTTSFYGVNNLDLPRNLATRVDQLRAVLAGRDHLWYLGGSFGNPATEWAIVVAAGVILWRALARRSASRGPLAVVLFTLFAFLQSIFTVSGLFPTHLAVLIPFFPLIIALGADGLIVDVLTARTRGHKGTKNHNLGVLVSSWLGGSAGRWAKRISLLLALPIGGLITRDVWADVNYHRALARTGGLNSHSDAVYALAAYIDQTSNPGPVLALDWGMAPVVRFLTAGRVAPDEIFGYSWEPDAEFDARLAVALDDQHALFILHWPQETIFPRREAFEEALAGRGLRAVTVRTFSRRDGAPIFDVVRVEKEK